jgi:MFS family permease
MSRTEAGILGTAALLISALGGWITGVLCDRFGRVRMLQVSILWFAFFTFLRESKSILHSALARICGGKVVRLG